MLQYYKVNNPNSGKIASVYRVGNDSERFRCERYDVRSKGWIDYPDVVGSLTGAGRDMDLEPSDEAEVLEFIRVRSLSAPGQNQPEEVRD
jgi:hypothetical protein